MPGRSASANFTIREFEAVFEVMASTRETGGLGLISLRLPRTCS